MDGLIVLGVLAVLWVLVGPVVALVNALIAKQTARALLQRIAALEAQIAAGALAAAPTTTAAPVRQAAPPVSATPAAERDPGSAS